jgi:hypothetical protein
MQERDVFFPVTRRSPALDHYRFQDGCRMSLSEAEFANLRQTITMRGTVRILLLPVTLVGWSLLAGALVLFNDLPIGALLSLAVLIGGFESIHALHVGVERIGRYIQVFYEGTSDGPHWETTAMAVGPSLPGGGVDPLFTVVFASATIANLIPVLLPQPVPLELGVVGAFHLAFVIRLARARGAAARQRALELESFRALRSQTLSSKSQT